MTLYSLEISYLSLVFNEVFINTKCLYYKVKFSYVKHLLLPLSYSGSRSWSIIIRTYTSWEERWTRCCWRKVLFSLYFLKKIFSFQFSCFKFSYFKKEFRVIDCLETAFRAGLSFDPQRVTTEGFLVPSVQRVVILDKPQIVIGGVPVSEFFEIPEPSYNINQFFSDEEEGKFYIFKIFLFWVQQQ